MRMTYLAQLTGRAANSTRDLPSGPPRTVTIAGVLHLPPNFEFAT